MKIQSGGEKMRNASFQEGVTSKVKMRASDWEKKNMNTGNKILGKHIMATIPP